MNLRVNGQLPPDIRNEDEMYHAPNPISVIGEISRIVNSRIIEGEEKNPLFQKSSRLLLMELGQRDGVTQLDLVKATHLKAPTISIALQKLERDGYVARKHDSYDLRSIRVFLTDKGRSYNRLIIKKVIDTEEDAMMPLSDAETKQLMRLLIKLRENMLENSETNKFKL